jgi:hypothetical protein
MLRVLNLSRARMLRSGLVVGITMTIAVGCRTERGQSVAGNLHAVSETPAASERASADAERVHRWVAAGDWPHLTQEWEVASQVLLRDLDGRDLRARDAACALIALGRAECVDAMIASLKSHGMIQIAEAYLNSGHAALSEAAAAWACQNGWMVEECAGKVPTTWGSMGSAAPPPKPKPTVAIIDLQPGFDRELMAKHENALKKMIEDSLPKGPLHELGVLQAMEPGTVTVSNPNRCTVAVALRSKRNSATGFYEYGKDFGVAARGSTSMGVCLGEFDIYYVYSTDPTALFRGDTFHLSEGKQCDCETTIILPP